MPGSVCAITASEKLYDSVWFIKIKSKEVSEETVIYNYGNKIILGQSYFTANYFEKVFKKSKVKKRAVASVK